MDNKSELAIQQYYRHVCVLTVVAAIVLAALRAALTPIAFNQSLPYGIALAVTGVLLATLLTVSVLKTVPSIKVGGRMARVFAASMAVFGATLVVYSLEVAREWFTLGVVPYPSKFSVTRLDETLVLLQIVAGLVGGIVFLLLAAQWWCAKRTTRRCSPLFALLPVLWGWVRLVRYITSHISSVGLFRNAYDLGMIVFEILFFVLLARYISDVGEKPSRFFFGILLCTGLLCAVSSITQTALFLAQDQTAFDTCALVTAPDFGVAVLAFSMAFAQAFGIPVEDEDEAEDQEMSEDEDQGAEYLISDQWFAVYDPEEEDADN